MTPERKRVLDFITKYAAENGYSPTLQEVGDALGKSKITVFEMVEALVATRHLRKRKRKGVSKQSRCYIPTGVCPYCGTSLAEVLKIITALMK